MISLFMFYCSNLTVCKMLHFGGEYWNRKAGSKECFMFVIKCFAIYSTIVIWLLGQGNSSIYYGALSCTVDNQGTYSVDWNDFPIHEKNII